MRLDYALYGLAIVLFAIAAITFAMVAEQDGRTVYAVSTAAVGLLSIGGGYFLRPKAQAARETAAIQTPPPTPQVAAAEPIQRVTAPVDAPKTEPPVVEAPSPEPVAAVEAPRAESPIVEAPVVVELGPPVEMGPKTVPAEGKSVFSQIRGISEKRAEELKANGINTVEELANASAEDLAAKLNVSPKIVKMWIGSARKLK
jgi:predicted flap endonuclease-1-like 5' DNA nuclease